MKKLLYFMLTAALTLGFSACGNDDEVDNKKPETAEDPSKNTTDDIVTGEAVDVSYTSATLYGYINNEADKYSDFGIVYGKENDAAHLARSGVKVKAGGFDAGTSNHRFSVSLRGLKAGTTYYYYAYAGQKNANKALSFSTPLDMGGCPDTNHPHWIDLGLPSGTKWRCCNEGTSTPEAYGEYYTFGQVSTAPTYNQIEELLDKCKYTWTTQNGVQGGQFTGPNGGTIFLPSAGNRYRNGELSNVGSWGYYWSSTHQVNNVAYSLQFDSRGAYRGGGSYHLGNSVRPVGNN